MKERRPMCLIAVVPLLLCLQVSEPDYLPDWASDCSDVERVTQLEALFRDRAKQPTSITQIPALLRAFKENRRHYDVTGNESNYLALFVLEKPLVDCLKRFGVYPGRLPDQLLIYSLRRIVEERWTFEHQFSADQLRDRTVYLYLPDGDSPTSVVEAAKRIVPFRYRIVNAQEAASLEDSILRSPRSADVLLKVIDSVRFGNYYWVRVAGTVDMGIAVLAEVDQKSPDKGQRLLVLFGDLP